MLFKKQIIGASLLSLGMLAGGSFVGNSSALAAGSNFKQVKTEKESQEFKILKRGDVFEKINNTDWNMKENIAKLQDNLKFYTSDVSDNTIMYIDIKTLLRQFNIDPKILGIFDNLNEKEKYKLTETLQKKLSEVLLKERDIKGLTTKIVFTTTDFNHNILKQKIGDFKTKTVDIMISGMKVTGKIIIGSVSVTAYLGVVGASFVFGTPFLGMPVGYYLWKECLTPITDYLCK